MKTSLLCVIAAVLFVAGDLNAQVASKPAAAAKVEPVTDQIPAGALGFIAIKDIAGAAAKAERYINDIGLGEPYLQALTAMGLEEPNKGMLSLLKLLPIGDGLNTSGGVAVV